MRVVCSLSKRASKALSTFLWHDRWLSNIGFFLMVLPTCFVKKAITKRWIWVLGARMLQLTMLPMLLFLLCFYSSVTQSKQSKTLRSNETELLKWHRQQIYLRWKKKKWYKAANEDELFNSSSTSHRQHTLTDKLRKKMDDLHIKSSPPHVPTLPSSFLILPFSSPNLLLP